MLWKASLVSFPQQTFQPDSAKWGEFFGIIVCVLIEILKQLVSLSHFVTTARYCCCVKERESLSVQNPRVGGGATASSGKDSLLHSKYTYFTILFKELHFKTVCLYEENDSPTEGLRGKQFKNLEAGRKHVASHPFYHREAGLSCDFS